MICSKGNYFWNAKKNKKKKKNFDSFYQLSRFRFSLYDLYGATNLRVVISCHKQSGRQSIVKSFVEEKVVLQNNGN